MTVLLLLVTLQLEYLDFLKKFWFCNSEIVFLFVDGFCHECFNAPDYKVFPSKLSFSHALRKVRCKK